MPLTHEQQNGLCLMSKKRLLEVNDLTIQFGPNKPVVDQVSFNIFPRETLALVGESGSGKSLSALSLLKLLPGAATITKGKIIFNHDNILDFSQEKLEGLRGGKISMIFQEPMTSLNPLHSILKQVQETLIIHRGMNEKDAKNRVIELLELVGLRNAEKRLSALPHELSGGERQRVMIAMALANEPDLLIADEPTTALDVTIQEQILDLLANLQKKMGMAILFITHDLNIVQRFADRVAVMSQGEIVEEGPTKDIFSHPKNAYTKKLINSLPSGSAPALPKNNPNVINSENITVTFPLQTPLFSKKRVLAAVDGISLNINKGETLGIVGESGSGKTTLAMAILRLQKSEGTIEFDNVAWSDLSRKDLRAKRKDMQVVFQDPYSSLNPRRSIFQIIKEGLDIHFNLTETETHTRVLEILNEVELDERFLHRYPHELSGGQRQRIAIARSLVLNPKLLILDEPTSALDMTVQKQIITLLRSLQEKLHLSYLFISHDLRVIKAMSHRIIVMKDGKIVEEGPVDQIYSSPQHAYTQKLLHAAK